jgi:large subunit ribosomal protein L7/L12
MTDEELVQAILSLPEERGLKIAKQISEYFGLSAYPVAVYGAAPYFQDEPQQTEFDVVLDFVPLNNKIRTIQVVRAINLMPLAEAKRLVESAPVVVLANVSRLDAQFLQDKFTEAGAKASIK